MTELRLAITALGCVIGFLAVMLLGDYLGYKVGRRNLLSTSGLIALGVVVAFAIAAAVLVTRG